MSNFGMGMPPMNPDMAAMLFAQQNGISVNDAKAVLRQQFGDPVPPSGNFMQQGFKQYYCPPDLPVGGGVGGIAPAQPYDLAYSPARENPESELTSKYGIPADVVAQGEDAVRKYAEEHNIKLPKKGTRTNTQRTHNNRTSMEEQLITKYGIPANIVAKGDDAIRKYAQEHNINLPAKGQR